MSLQIKKLGALCFIRAVRPILMLAAFAAPSLAQDLEFSASPTPVGSGARAAGMANAFVAIADDATAASWTGNARLSLNLVTTPRDTPDVALTGQWLRSRADVSVAATTRAVFHRATDGEGDLITEREEGVRGSLAYPLSRTRRVVAALAATRAPLLYRYAVAEPLRASGDC